VLSPELATPIKLHIVTGTHESLPNACITWRALTLARMQIGRNAKFHSNINA
jgi:hypothetical protein